MQALIICPVLPKGSLEQLFTRKSYSEWDFRFSLINDIIQVVLLNFCTVRITKQRWSQGLSYIHGSFIEYHGRLRDFTCLISNRFTIQLSEYGYVTILNLLSEHTYSDEIAWDRSLPWVAPELIQHSAVPAPSSDIYALGIILQEIILWKPVQYTILQSVADYDINQLCARIETNSLLVTHKQLINLISLATQCTSVNTNERGDIRSIGKEFKMITGIENQLEFIDKIMERLQQYAKDLEDQVMERVEMLQTERKKNDDLLLEMLPRLVYRLAAPFYCQNLLNH